MLHYIFFIQEIHILWNKPVTCKRAIAPLCIPHTLSSQYIPNIVPRSKLQSIPTSLIHPRIHFLDPLHPVARGRGPSVSFTVNCSFRHYICHCALNHVQHFPQYDSMCNLGRPLFLSKLESHVDLYGQTFVSIKANVPLCCLLLHHSLPPPPHHHPPSASSAWCVVCHVITPALPQQSTWRTPSSSAHGRTLYQSHSDLHFRLPCLSNTVIWPLDLSEAMFFSGHAFLPLVWLYPHSLLLWLFFGKWDCSPAKSGLPHGFLRTTWQLTCLVCS